MKLILSFLVLMILICSCCRVPTQIEPRIKAPPHPREIQRNTRCHLSLPEDFSKTPFSPLSEEEQSANWGIEYAIALGFAEDFDLYRAITGFKRTLFLIPKDHPRVQEVEYYQVLAYYLASKYEQALYSVESSSLVHVKPSFCAYEDLLIVLYDTYLELGKEEHARCIVQLMEKENAATAHRLTLYEAIQNANWEIIQEEQKPYFEAAYAGYHQEYKSVRKAKTLNALLPGAGYWYVEQKSTALTAFLINSLFIGASATCFCKDQIAAGIVLASLEGGWYFGGILGAGLGAKTYNEHLYRGYISKINHKENIFPMMMLKYSF